MSCSKNSRENASLRFEPEKVSVYRWQGCSCLVMIVSLICEDIFVDDIDKEDGQEVE